MVMLSQATNCVWCCVPHWCYHKSEAKSKTVCLHKPIPFLIVFKEHSTDESETSTASWSSTDVRPQREKCSYPERHRLYHSQKNPRINS
jgi:hypothetical protein